ncbi:MAG: hypothetical protein A2103_02685 [Gammaproteobacteria bacterium GWF2_41_13]|nr:MAG: hypothetical protein A2103_02685 [Gammaproteobacteria bacterium GWF2_41_13]
MTGDQIVSSLLAMTGNMRTLLTPYNDEKTTYPGIFKRTIHTMKAKHIIPCCYHPTTPLLLDDEQAYLDSLVARLDNIPQPYEYNTPAKALQFITKNYQSSIDSTAWSSNLQLERPDLDEADLDEHEHALIEIDISSIYKQVFNPLRFKELAVILSDYEMPGLNGLEFFKKIEDKPFQKLLLTGHASHTLGINAFNDGIIERFVDKSTSDDTSEFTTRINAVFRELEKRYFQKLSINTFQNLSKNKRSALGEPFFFDLFHQLVEKNHIIEYYLVSDTGCFLMLNEMGQKSWLIAKSEEDMRYFYNTAVDNEAPETIIELLKKREHVLFLFSEQDENEVPCDDWERYLHPAERKVGEKNTFYCAYSHSQPVYDQQLETIFSYRDFLTG